MTSKEHSIQSLLSTTTNINLVYGHIIYEAIVSVLLMKRVEEEKKQMARIYWPPFPSPRHSSPASFSCHDILNKKCTDVIKTNDITTKWLPRTYPHFGNISSRLTYHFYQWLPYSQASFKALMCQKHVSFKVTVIVVGRTLQIEVEVVVSTVEVEKYCTPRKRFSL